jgi:transposase
MKRIPKQEYTVQFKDQAVAMVKGGKTVPEAARALGLVEQTLRNWVKLAAKGKLHDGATEITPEQMELSRLRAENARLRLENEILKKATAYFAKDAL